MALSLNIDSTDYSVLYLPQTLTDEQKAQARENIGALAESDIGGVINIQYVRACNVTNNYFWFHTNGLPYKYAYNDYSTLEPLILPAGQYYMSAMSSVYCWIIGSDGVVRKLLDVEPGANVSSGGFVLTLTETSKLYLSYYTPTNFSATTPYIIKGTNPLPAADYFQGNSFENVNTDVFVESYIKNCEVVANDLLIMGDSIGHYNGVKMDGNIRQMRCKAKMTPNASVALVTTKNGSSKVTDITSGSLHLVFGFNNCAVGIFDTAGNLRSAANISYSIYENAEVSFGFDVDESANKLTVYLPDGKTQTVTDADISARNGKYAIWEHFCVRSTVGFKCCKLTKFYCKDENGEVMDDDFLRPDGALGVAPTGQPYRQFTSHNQYDHDYK